jgi:hypothetical protein
LAALAIALSGSVLAVSAAPVAAYSGYYCYNTGCNGLSPDHSYSNHYPCDAPSTQVVTAKEVWIAAGGYSHAALLELRYSTNCGAAWAKVTAQDLAGTYQWKITSSTGAVYYEQEYLAKGGGTWWTLMVGDAGSLRATAYGTLCCQPESQWFSTGSY